jgi:hypothetical protein
LKSTISRPANASGLVDLNCLKKFVATEDFRDFVLKPSMLPRGLFRNFLQSGCIWLSPDKEPSESGVMVGSAAVTIRSQGHERDAKEGCGAAVASSIISLGNPNALLSVEKVDQTWSRPPSLVNSTPVM